MKKKKQDKILVNNFCRSLSLSFFKESLTLHLCSRRVRRKNKPNHGKLLWFSGLQSPLAPPSLLITELTEKANLAPLKFAILYTAATKPLPCDICPTPYFADLKRDQPVPNTVSLCV